MNAAETMIIGIVTGVVCFLLSFYFFNKLVKLDKKQSDQDKDTIIFITSNYYKKLWMNEHINTVKRMVEINLLIRLLVDNDIIKAAAENNMKLSGKEGVIKIIDYFTKDTEGSKRMLSNIKQNKFSEIEDFSKKALDYLDYFFDVNNLVEPTVFALNHEMAITEKYASHKKAKARLHDINFSLMALANMSNRVNKCDSSQDSGVNDGKVLQS